jgi:hypothetical protein
LPAKAQTANITAENAAVFNLLSPFLDLNAMPVGQQTLQANLSQAVAINQNTSLVALLNDNMATPALAALAISDENLLGKASNAVTGLSATYGVAANLAGGLPTQTTTAWAQYNGQQPVGGFGSVLGAAYVRDVGSNGSAVTLANTIALLTTANNQIVNTVATGDSQVAKFYFANGTWNGTATAVAPGGSTLPTANGLPSTTSSVYDTAYGVSNATSGQNSYGDSHPYQTAPVNGYAYTLYDSTVKSKSPVSGAPTPSTNPSFPSSHMAYAMTDSLLLGMAVPELYQSMLMRASEMGNSRIVVGVHYPLDIIASRAMASFDLANLLSNPSYINNAAVTGTSVNLPGLFTAAAPELQAQLTQAATAAGCGTSIATCATSSANVNPYAPSATNAAVYAARLTYGLPTLSFAAALAEQAPSGGPDASILLATLYGGSTAQSQALAASVGGALYGNLSTNTINQVIQNTETNALAAFHGTSLSYWSRLNLYAAAGYFQDVTDAIAMASTDHLATNVTVGSTGAFKAGGTIAGNVTVNQGGTFTGSTGISGGFANSGLTVLHSADSLTVAGSFTQSSTGALRFTIGGHTAGTSYSLLKAGSADLNGTIEVVIGGSGYAINAGDKFDLLDAAGGIDLEKGLSYEFLVTATDAGFFSNDDLTPYGGDSALDPDRLYEIGAPNLFSVGLVNGGTTLEVTADETLVPEPATALILLPGLLALLLRRRAA